MRWCWMLMTLTLFAVGVAVAAPSPSPTPVRGICQWGPKFGQLCTGTADCPGGLCVPVVRATP